MEELLTSSSSLNGEVWLSCTSPLKHQLQQLTGQVGPDAINSVNQIRRVDGIWHGTNTDGIGFVNACRYFGIDPEGKTLNIRGGGSAARSIADSWASSGGLLVTSIGRRPLPHGPWDDAVIDSDNADIGVDMDVPAGGSTPQQVAARHQVSVSYDGSTDASEFPIVMLAAQHLESWKSFFSPENSDRLPGLAELLSAL